MQKASRLSSALPDVRLAGRFTPGRTAGLGSLGLPGIVVPPRGKKKIEMTFCATVTALVSAQRGCRYQAALVLQIFTVAAILAPDHCPSESRSPWSQHHAALGMAGWALGRAAQPAACGRTHRHPVSWVCSDLTLQIKPPVLPRDVCLQSRSVCCKAQTCFAATGKTLRVTEERGNGISTPESQCFL